ncbi:unnamed protein product [Ceratitis capitata]|uniref:Carboxylic ester hydrolase n=1 Tax=Ceratitis capitata TaxID=7213 RepID=A0A811VHP5_CERCA|nr:unnamed protein product [Ceratitis capitata]
MATLTATDAAMPTNNRYSAFATAYSTHLWRTVVMLSVVIAFLSLQPTTTTTTTPLITTATTAPPKIVEQNPHENVISPSVCIAEMSCLQGKIMMGVDHQPFEAYLGIPYAMPPVGELRFANPRAFPRWRGFRDASVPKQECVQKNYILPGSKVEGVEDCLYLNVYVPKPRTQKSLPVMVYIHGGGWFSGTANPSLQGPEYFMATGEVILVVFAYRLGPFGFLSTDDANMPGNLALKDQKLAFRWIHENIAAFGGAPELVTVFGQSAGAISAHLHVLSGNSEGLFHKFITMSGTANVPFAINDKPLQQVLDMARFCNISNAEELSTAELARALRAVSAYDLVSAGDNLKYWDVDPMTNFRPIVEKSAARDAFLTEHPLKLLNEGKYKPLPWLAGAVPGEGAVRVFSILANATLRRQFNEKFYELLGKLLEFPEKFNRTQVTEKTQQVIDEYFGGQTVLNNDTARDFLECISDRGFHHPYYNAIRTYVNTMDVKKYPVYLYKFNYEGHHGFTNLYTSNVNIGKFGVVHCDDLIYAFRAPLIFGDFEPGSSDAAASKLFVDNFISFAKYGKPLSEFTPRPCNATAFAPSAESQSICDYLEFMHYGTDGFTIGINNKFNVRRAEFWNKILEIV